MSPRNSIRALALLSVLSALTYTATAVLHFPVPGGVFHLGDGVIFLAAILYGGRMAAISGAVGMTLFDIFSPWIVYAPYTFVIKGAMGLVTGMVAWGSGRQGRDNTWNIIGVALGGATMVFGYYLTKAFMVGDFITPIATAVPYDILQVIGGALVGLPIARSLKKTRYFGA